MKTLSSCLRGRRHILRREPCEDRFAVLPLPGGLAAAAADGHGDARCCRAGFGARVACASALHALSDPALPPEALAGAIRQRYERLCRRHLARHPLTEREQALLAGLDPLYAYGTTLVCARTDAAGTTLLRIGDSEVLALGPDGLPFPILAADPNCTGSATTSLADPDAETAARVARYDRPAAALLLFTDGYSYRGQLPAGLLDLLRAPCPTPSRRSSWTGETTATTRPSSWRRTRRSAPGRASAGGSRSSWTAWPRRRRCGSCSGSGGRSWPTSAWPRRPSGSGRGRTSAASAATPGNSWTACRRWTPRSPPCPPLREPQAGGKMTTPEDGAGKRKENSDGRVLL